MMTKKRSSRDRENSVVPVMVPQSRVGLFPVVALRTPAANQQAKLEDEFFARESSPSCRSQFHVRREPERNTRRHVNRIRRRPCRLGPLGAGPNQQPRLSAVFHSRVL